jgi:large subunit ribosomal protein L4
MKLTIKDMSGKNAGEVQVKFPVIESMKGTQAVHDYVVAYNAAQRMGTACTKTPGEVAGTNRKPWRQKGTGRARAGSFRSPLWRGGGVTFGPKPRDFSKKLNVKVKKLALQKSLSSRLQAGEVTIVEDIKLSGPKTKELLKFLSSLKLEGSLMIVVGEANRNLLLASRNVPGVHMSTGDDLNTYDVLLAKNLLFTRSGFEKVEQRLLPSQP